MTDLPDICYTEYYRFWMTRYYSSPIRLDYVTEVSKRSKPDLIFYIRSTKTPTLDDLKKIIQIQRDESPLIEKSEAILDYLALLDSLPDISDDVSVVSTDSGLVETSFHRISLEEIPCQEHSQNWLQDQTTVSPIELKLLINI